MALKDNSGLVKKYAMVNVRKYQIVGIGDSVDDCEKSYSRLMSGNGLIKKGSAGTEDHSAEGRITRMAQAVIDGDTHYYLVLDDQPAIYDVKLPGLIEIVRYKTGDKIQLKYRENGDTNTVTEISDTKADTKSETEQDKTDTKTQ